MVVLVVSFSKERRSNRLLLETPLVALKIDVGEFAEYVRVDICRKSNNPARPSLRTLVCFNNISLALGTLPVYNTASIRYYDYLKY